MKLPLLISLGLAAAALPALLVAESPRADFDARLRSGTSPTITSPADNGTNPLPRFYHGRFERTRRILMFGPPYEFQLMDSRGRRFAYLDLSQLLVTDTIENYLGRTVAVYGTAKPTDNNRDIYIEVESLQVQ